MCGCVTAAWDGWGCVEQYRVEYLEMLWSCGGCVGEAGKNRDDNVEMGNVVYHSENTQEMRRG